MHEKTCVTLYTVKRDTKFQLNLDVFYNFVYFNLSFNNMKKQALRKNQVLKYLFNSRAFI